MKLPKEVKQNIRSFVKSANKTHELAISLISYFRKMNIPESKFMPNIQSVTEGEFNNDDISILIKDLEETFEYYVD